MLSLIAIPLLAMNLSFGRKVPWSYLPWGLSRWIWALLTVSFIALVFRRDWQEKLENPIKNLLTRRSLWVLLVLWNATDAVLSHFYFKAMGYSFPTLHLAICVVSLFWVRGDRPQRAAAFSIAFLVASIIHFPLDGARSDMLYVIQHALDLWGSGQAAYAPFTYPSGETHQMPYLPGTLFAHLPAWSMGIDLRWNTVLYRTVWVVLLIQAAKRSAAPRSSVQMLSLVLMSPFLNWRHELYFEFFLFLIAFLVIFREKLSILVLPLLILTRQWSWIFAPFVVVDSFKKKGIKAIAALVASSAVTTLVMTLLLRGSLWKDVISAIFQFQSLLENPAYQGDYGLTLAPVFYALGISGALQKLQAISCIAVFLIAYKKREWVYSGWIALILFIIFNPHYWNYFWLSPIVYLLSYFLSDPRSDLKIQSERTPIAEKSR